MPAKPPVPPRAKPGRPSRGERQPAQGAGTGRAALRPAQDTLGGLHAPPVDVETSLPPSAGTGHQAGPRPSLVLVATPIGNLGDITARAAATLRDVDCILCEDTRTSANLLRHLGVQTPTASLHDHNEAARTPEILARMARGERFALISDAGTPLLSDPGYRLARAAIDAGHRVGGVPGANAALLALTLSGLPPHPYLFLGFLPQRQEARRRVLQTLRAAEAAGLSATLIAYEAPHRLAETLADCRDIFTPARPAAVARELTKLFEEVQRGSLDALVAHFTAQAPRGEIVLLLAPPAEEANADWEAMLAAALRQHSVREAAALVAAASGVARKTVYARALALRDAGDAPGLAAAPLAEAAAAEPEVDDAAQAAQQQQ